jgi:hypothetical protein
VAFNTFALRLGSFESNCCPRDGWYQEHVSSLLSCCLAQVELLPLCCSADLSLGQLPLLATLRKFVTKSVGIPEPDREAAMFTATQLAALLGTLAANYSSRPASAGSAADTLMQHAAVQLLPALEVRSRV